MTRDHLDEMLNISLSADQRRRAPVYIERDFRRILCGYVVEEGDRFRAINEVDATTILFWSRGGAELSLQLAGLLRGRV